MPIFIERTYKDGQMDDSERAGYGNLTSGQYVTASKKNKNINIFANGNTFKGALKSVHAKAPCGGINDLNLTDTETKLSLKEEVKMDPAYCCLLFIVLTHPSSRWAVTSW